MSLVVHLKRFKVPHSKSEKFARLEFRGVTKNSVVCKVVNDVVVVDQTFQWNLQSDLKCGEVLKVNLLYKPLIGPARSLGVYRLGLQVTVTDGQHSVIDSLLDERNNIVQAFVEMDVTYTKLEQRRPLLSMSDTEATPYNRRGSEAKPELPTVHGRRERRGSVPEKQEEVKTSKLSRLFTKRWPGSAQRASTASERPSQNPFITPDSSIKSGARSADPQYAETDPGVITTAPKPALTTPTKIADAYSIAAQYAGTTQDFPATHSPKNSHSKGSSVVSSAPHSPPDHVKATVHEPPKRLRPGIAVPYQSLPSHDPIDVHHSGKGKGSKAALYSPSVHLPCRPQSSKSSHGLDAPAWSTLIQPSTQGSSQSSLRDSMSSVQSVQSDTDDNELLDNLQRNIESMEQSLLNKDIRDTTDTIIDIEPPCVHESRGRKLKNVGKRWMKRGLSLGGEKTIKHVDERETKKSAFRMKSLMRFGRNRSRDAEAYDEEKGLIPVAGSSSDPDPPPCHVTICPEEILIDPRPTEDTPKMRKIRAAIDNAGPAALKAADFQVRVSVIEARQLIGLNMDPIVCVQVGDVRKYTNVKGSTNCPYFNEYFVFDFHMPPIMLLDKIITLSVLHSRSILRADLLLGNFKLDVATVWNQPDRVFYHKWALLTDPDDIPSGPKGYLKCDISVSGKGEPIKIPPKNNDIDEDDIEANLLLPDGVSIERQRTRFIVKIYKADGLPEMNYSLLANVKRAFTGESQDLVDPYVQVSYAGMTGRTSVKKNCYNPEWNEQITFTEMFPPLCQRIKIQLRDNAPMHQNIIGTHYIDLKNISNDGEKGFLPTFGPAYIHLYGSTRDYSILDQHSNLNVGMGEGISYRARMLVSIRTEILDSVECASSDVDIEPILPIDEAAFEKHEEFLLFASIHEAGMIDKSLVDKPIQFELSIGNAGNVLDGPRDSLRKTTDLAVPDLNTLHADIGYWQSVTPPMKAAPTDKTYYHLPYFDDKPCMHVRSIWPDHRRRMYNSNVIASIIDKFEEGLNDTQTTLEKDNIPDNTTLAALKGVLEFISNTCAGYVKNMSGAPPLGNTKLDRERQKMCIHEIEQIGINLRNLKALVTRNSIKERMRTAFSYLNRLKELCEDAQHAMPDVIIWMISNGKRLAYHRIPARDVIYSDVHNEAGRFCGKMQTVFLRWPGKKGMLPSGWSIPAKLNIYLWMGLAQEKKHFIDGLPPGYEVGTEIQNADILRYNPPNQMYYKEKHRFQLRAYMYQARSLIGSDSSGLSDPYAKIIIGDKVASTQVIDETLSPTWDELLLFNDIFLFSSMAQIKADPPTIVIEIFDQDKVGKSEFIGRALARPYVKDVDEVFQTPQYPISLEWHEIYRGNDNAGELLAAFELLEIPPNQDVSCLPQLPSPKELIEKSPEDLNKWPILPVPKGIRPTLSKYRIEVLFWGIRDLKRVHLLSVDKPRVDIECAGNIIYSTIIQNAKRNPNFTNPVRYVDVELPDQDLYRPPLTIRVVDCRSFGRNTLVGTHTINSIHKYLYTPKTKKEREMEERKKSIIQLQNIDLHNNCIYQEEVYTVDNDRESFPLLPRDLPRGRPVVRKQPTRTGARTLMDYRAITMTPDKPKKRKISSESSQTDDDASKDWWSKYFASVESSTLLDNLSRPGTSQASDVEYVDETRSPVNESPWLERAWRRQPTPSRMKTTAPNVPKINQIPTSSLAKVYPHELESALEFDEFKEWLHTFPLYRGKNSGYESDDENRTVGYFKGAIKVYKYPFPKGIDDYTIMGLDPNQGFFQGVPNNDPIHVLVRVYIVKATDLHPMDITGKADPYLVLQLGSKKICDKDNYISKQLNPVFGKCFEIEATFPQDSMLTVSLVDWDLVGTDELIGETKIDLENRFYSRHRATCGLPLRYERQGYNRWRDSLKPTQILAKLCKDGKLDPPIYEYSRVRVGRTIFNIPVDDPELFPDSDVMEEQMALHVLHRWQEVPRIGTRLVTEHIETRPLYNPNKPGMERGRVEMWVDMFPMDMPRPGPPLDISPRKPKPYELRVVVCNTDDVVLEDDAFFTGEKMSDIYVKGWLKSNDDCQTTDIHYRSLTGEGNFNWRFVYPFDYLEAEERMVISRKESLFSWDESESKIPPRLELQVWDADHFSSDDFLGALTLDLNHFPRGAKTSKLCTLDMLRDDGTVPMVNLFKQKRVRGWWPFYTKRDNEEMVLTGKVEAEIHLLTREEADKMPAGMGRSEPDPLDKPTRPDASFMWFLNPLRSLRYILWYNYKWTIIKVLAVSMVSLIFLMFLYAFPGYLVKKLLGV